MSFLPCRRHQRIFVLDRFAAGTRRAVSLLAVLLVSATAFAAAAKADPPPWAPAHGYWRSPHHGHDHDWVYTPDLDFEHSDILDHEYGAESGVDHNRSPYCREYSSVAVVAGIEQEIFGKACRQPDGSWRIMG